MKDRKPRREIRGGDRRSTEITVELSSKLLCPEIRDTTAQHLTCKRLSNWLGLQLSRELAPGLSVGPLV